MLLLIDAAVVVLHQKNLPIHHRQARCETARSLYPSFVTGQALRGQFVYVAGGARFHSRGRYTATGSADGQQISRSADSRRQSWTKVYRKVSTLHTLRPVDSPVDAGFAVWRTRL